jgi:hypothetical protein
MADRPNPPIDADLEPDEGERAAAESLRAELDGGTPGGEAGELARSLRAAWSPSDLSPGTHARIVDQAFARLDRRASRRRVRAVAGGVALALALSAGVAAILQLQAPPSRSPETLATSRSTQPLFDERFPVTGGEGDRVERISAARAADLRRNRFARWGLR